MSFTHEELLRLHVEAVWGVSLPPITGHDVELLPTSPLPRWELYVGQLASGRIHIWRPGIDESTRAELLALIAEPPIDQSPIPEMPDLSWHPADSSAPVAPKNKPIIRREVALHQIAQPELDSESARRIARPITVEDYALVEAFEPGEAAYFFEEGRGPLFGVVVGELLLSLAHSSRRIAAACELGVHTLTEARGHGYALAATILWAEAVAQEGLVPFYSALAENSASLRLAHKAGYRVFARGTTVGRG